MTEQGNQSRAVEFAQKALSDLSGAQRHSLTGQSRLIAALLFAHEEEFFHGYVSPGGVRVNLEQAWSDINIALVRRPESTERQNAILGHLFDVLEWNGERWQPNEKYTTAQTVAYRIALRRVLPSVEHLIKGAGKAPVISAEGVSDEEMMESGVACVILTGGPINGRLKVRQDLAVDLDTLTKAREGGQNLAKHPPVLLDGTSKRSIEHLGRVARERIGAVPSPDARANVRLGRVAAGLQTVRKTFLGSVAQPGALEGLPSGLLQDARTTALVLVASLFPKRDKKGEPTSTPEIDHETLEHDFEAFLARSELSEPNNPPAKKVA